MGLFNRKNKKQPEKQAEPKVTPRSDDVGQFLQDCMDYAANAPIKQINSFQKAANGLDRVISETAGRAILFCMKVKMRMRKLGDIDLAKLIKNTFIISEDEINEAIEIYHTIKVSPSILQSLEFESGVAVFFTAMKELVERTPSEDISAYRELSPPFVGDLSDEEWRAVLFCKEIINRFDIYDEMLLGMISRYYEIDEERCKLIVDAYKAIEKVKVTNALRSISKYTSGIPGREVSGNDKKEKQKELRAFEKELLDEYL